MTRRKEGKQSADFGNIEEYKGMPSSLRKRTGTRMRRQKENEAEKGERRGSHGEVQREGRGSTPSEKADGKVEGATRR